MLTCPVTWIIDCLSTLAALSFFTTVFLGYLLFSQACILQHFILFFIFGIILFQPGGCSTLVFVFSQSCSTMFWFGKANRLSAIFFNLVHNLALPLRFHSNFCIIRSISRNVSLGCRNKQNPLPLLRPNRKQANLAFVLGSPERYSHLRKQPVSYVTTMV